MQRIASLILPLIYWSLAGFSQTPVSHPAEAWMLNPGYSDEFNVDSLDLTKWNNDPNDWGTWSWEPYNAYITDSALTLRMVQDQHVRNNKDFYFTSGIIRNRQTMTYGYYEARIKASDKGQGTCPAFWTYSIGQPTPTHEGGVKYCEIDAIEIFQVPYDTMRLEMNLHTRIIENGVLTWKRPGRGDTELTHNTWVAPWDPRDDYHTYGVWNRHDSIFWYVDGVQRGAKKNYYWHLPMYPTVSLGLRTPYERYINGVRTVMPYPDSIPEPGFPTEMFCDYVRVWNTPPQLYADKELYYEAEFPVEGELAFDVRYFAGNGEQVEAGTWNGVSCKLQEIDANGGIVQEIELTDADAIGEASGLAEFRFSLTGLTPSVGLPAGHQYILKPAFHTSFNGGEDVFLAEEYYPVTLTHPTRIHDALSKAHIAITQHPEGVRITLTHMLSEEANIIIHDLAGREIYHNRMKKADALISNQNFPTGGVYTISVHHGQFHRIEKVLIHL
ncbi:MAG: family 16 glycosylhydrolase [Bacteroidota bacterium]